MQTYRIASKVDLKVESLGGREGLIFNASTGATTLVCARALRVLNLLSTGVFAESELAASLVPEFDGEEAIAEVLALLENAKLIIRC